MPRKTTKVNTRRLGRRIDSAHEALSDAVDALGAAERRERALSGGEDATRGDLAAKYDALKGGR